MANIYSRRHHEKLLKGYEDDLHSILGLKIEYETFFYIDIELY